MLAAKARAKINLALHIIGLRPDAYHTLSSLVAFAEYGDEVRVAPAAELSLDIDGEFAHQLTGAVERNLIWQVATRLQAVRGVTLGAAISLTKHLPIASGIGGGSSDAATAALLLGELWQLGLGKAELAEILLPLGADIPMCLYGEPVLVEGIGEKITPLAGFPRYHLLLVNPRVAVATAEVFALYDAACGEPSPAIEMSEDWLACLQQSRNDLQAPACQMAPIIREVLAALKASDACLLARMSGSGATCFGLYASEEAAHAAAACIAAEHPEWWARVSCFSV